MKIANKVINMIGFSMVIFSLSLANAGGSVGNGGGTSSGLSMKFSGVGALNISESKLKSMGNLKQIYAQQIGSSSLLSVHQLSSKGLMQRNLDYNKLSPTARNAVDASIQRQNQLGSAAGWVTVESPN